MAVSHMAVNQLSNVRLDMARTLVRFSLRDYDLSVSHMAVHQCRNVTLDMARTLVHVSL